MECLAWEKWAQENKFNPCGLKKSLDNQRVRGKLRVVQIQKEEPWWQVDRLHPVRL